MIFVMSLLLTLPVLALAGAVTEKDFHTETTEDLINLCDAKPDDPLYLPAISYCHGFMMGAYSYYQAQTAGPKGIKLVCVPEPQPSRNEGVRMFIEWAKAHPQYMKEKPVETEFRFLIEKWPCKP
jgi:hypothetical protein